MKGALPAIGLGTRLLLDDVCVQVVCDAIETGYRYIDTAPIYGNEAAIGEGIRRSGIGRDAMLVTTKVERDDLAAAAVRRSVERSLRALDFDRLDLVLIHWPNETIPLAETIATLCALRNEGMIADIGVANFPIALLDQAIELAGHHDVRIAANQIEVHPSLPQSKLVEACRLRGVAAIAYAPLGREDLGHPTVAEIAARAGRSPTQIIMRWHYQRGILPIPIPSTGTRGEIDLPYDISDFALSPADLDSLSTLGPQKRYFDPTWAPTWDPQS